jgi:DNA-binding IclR family transcriptional regulator
MENNAVAQAGGPRARKLPLMAETGVMAASERDKAILPTIRPAGMPAPIPLSARGVQSIEIGGRILTVLLHARLPMMLRDLAGEAGLTPGQAHAYLVSLRKLELVEQDSATGRYQLGPFALHLGLARQRATDAVRLATAAAAALSEKTGLMTVVTVWGTGGATVVYVEEGANQIVINVRPGIVYSIVSTATGRVFAAFLPSKVVEPALARELQNQDLIQQAGGPVDPRVLQADFAAIRQRGFGATVDRPIPGLTAIAAPVFDFTSRMQLALTLVGPSQAMDTGEGSALVGELLDVTNTISAKLGHLPETEPLLAESV